MYHNGKNQWTPTNETMRLYGGISARTGEQSVMDLPTIIACADQLMRKHPDKAPTLTNAALFQRDGNICLYCGQSYPDHKLTRDHVVPSSRGGKDVWQNVVAACRGCNQLKDNRTPEEADMPLLAVPFVPTRAAALILKNRRITGDQLDYLKAHLAPEEHVRLSKYLN